MFSVHEMSPPHLFLYLEKQKHTTYIWTLPVGTPVSRPFFYCYKEILFIIIFIILCYHGEEKKTRSMVP